MNSGNAQLLVERRSWTSILLWSFGITFAVLLFLWLRVNDINLLANFKANDNIYLLPYVPAFIFGSIMGIVVRNRYNNCFNVNFLQQPFLSLWISIFIFSITFALWSARPNHLMLRRSYIADVFSHIIFSFFLALFWIFIPFLIGYSMTKLFQCAINSMCCKKIYS